MPADESDETTPDDFLDEADEEPQPDEIDMEGIHDERGDDDDD